MPYYIYIIYSKSLNRYYIGHSNNINRGLIEHNSAQSKSTKADIPWTLVYSKHFNSRSEAAKEETRIKRMKSRKFIERLIAST